MLVSVFVHCLKCSKINQNIQKCKSLPTFSHDIQWHYDIIHVPTTSYYILDPHILYLNSLGLHGPDLHRLDLHSLDVHWIGLQELDLHGLDLHGLDIYILDLHRLEGHRGPFSYLK